MIGSLVKLVTVVSLAACSLAKPVRPSRRDDSPSFDNFNGLSSLQNFDNFFGRDNFDGGRNQLIVFQEKQVVCRQIDVEIIQQKLTILREFMKRILVEQVCEVETQTVLIEQFNSGVSNFGRDVRRKSNRQVTFDSEISSKITELFSSSDLSLTVSNHNFNGGDVGRNSIISSGSNWNDNSSPQSVGSIWDQCQVANNNAQNSNSSEPAITTTAAPTSTAASSSASASATTTK